MLRQKDFGTLRGQCSGTRPLNRLHSSFLSVNMPRALSLPSVSSCVIPTPLSDAPDFKLIKLGYEVNITLQYFMTNQYGLLQPRDGRLRNKTKESLKTSHLRD